MAPVLVLPDAVVPLALRVGRAQRVFLTEQGAEDQITEASLRPLPYGPPRRLRPAVQISVERRRGWPVYTVRPVTGTPTGAVVYVHGGGWVQEIVKAHWQLIAQIAQGSGTTVVVPIYPLLPYGAAADVVSGVVDVVLEARAAYGDTRLAGDSAGGQIALSTAQVLRDEHQVILSRTVLISPALDLTWSNPRIDQVQPSDPWLARPGGKVLSERWAAGLPLDDPRVSPLFGEPAGLGPITVLSGTRDILNPDADLLAERAGEASVEVDYSRLEGQLHVYPLLPTRTGAKARRQIVEALRRDGRGHDG